MNGDESMDERGSTVEKTNDKVSESQELIIEMVNKIDNQELLVKIYSFIKVIYEM